MHIDAPISLIVAVVVVNGGVRGVVGAPAATGVLTVIVIGCVTKACLDGHAVEKWYCDQRLV